ncbi:MAG TPA: beta-propeller fold lactonase family protein [Polyangiaceae bacterium]|nr:beta-propeller fold lactonase family protein [Polyangiaceae bacterium]
MQRLLGVYCGVTLAAIAACSDPASQGGSADPTDQLSAPLHKGPPPKVTRTNRPYTLFETLQVRPLALSPSGRLLFALNTPDDRLEVFRVTGNKLKSVGSVPVGLEPVAVAARSENEVWVVNHLSDSVSVVDVSDDEDMRVTRTLLVGDEPRDIVFAGARHDRAFVTTAHRGQNSPDDPDLFNPAAGRADVWVFDANNLGAAMGGQRLTKLTFFADTPRALAVTPDGKTVYAAAFLSGNQTTTVAEDSVKNVYNGIMPGPATITLGGQTIPMPTTGLIVKWKPGEDGTSHWFDAYGTIFDDEVKVRLPDNDVFTIDATANPPAGVASGTYNHVGTTLFNMAVNPKTKKIYVSNTDAHNDVRFEGHTPGFTSVVGNEVDSRISVLDPSTMGVSAANLNPHLNHAAGTGNPSLSAAFPLDMAVSNDGRNLYVVAQGSSKLLVYDTKAIETSSVTPNAHDQVTLSGGGPTGVVVDEHSGLGYVLTRFDDAISVVDLDRRREIGHVKMWNPEPPVVTNGRKFLYDATHTSALGDQACASCHVGGDNDALAWDLGNPGNIPLPITTTYANEAVLQAVPESAIIGFFGPEIAGVFAAYLPVKGPMTTQSLRGLDNHGAMHWRGDRNGAIQQTGAPFLDGGQPAVTAQPNGGMFNELFAFKSFNVAFPGLVGDTAQLSDDDMTAFASFMLESTYPPNPIRNLDNSLTDTQAAGRAFFFNQHSDGTEAPVDRFHDCNGCHTLDPAGNSGMTAHPGFFGTSGRLSFENEAQLFKIPHLRNAYTKVGMFGSSPDSVINVASLIPPLNPVVDAVRGFGYLHDGSIGSLEHFLTPVSFLRTSGPLTANGVTTPPNPDGIPLFANDADPLNPAYGISTEGLALRRAISSFVLAFDTNMLPAVGQQVTLTNSNASAVGARIDLMEAQAAAGACDLVAQGSLLDQSVGFVLSNGAFQGDLAELPPIPDSALRKLVRLHGDALTFTCVPPGSGFRIGIDRDGDGYANRDELLWGSDPSDPTSVPR